VDPYYLLSKLKSVGANAGLINLACDLNKKRPQMIVRKIEAFLESRSKAIKGSNLLLIGLGYKKNISDLRESPAIEILDLLINLGCNLKWHDPLVTSNHSQRDVQRELDLSPELLKNQDLCVILADHDLIDWDMVLNYSSCILDTKNKFANCHSSII
jgi:UDP-N-acetyl-D-glucosamine dehydrogenase